MPGSLSLRIPMLLATACLAACAGLPDRVEPLERARIGLSSLERQPAAGRVAATDLAAARDALARADRAYDKSEPIELVEHNAYVAQRHVDIAAERIAEAAARDEVARSEAERNRIIADAREREAAAAEARNEALRRELEALQAQPTDRGLVLTLGDVLFDTGAAALKPGAMTTIDRLAQFLRDYPERSVRIEGHTDSVGSDESNQLLSERRANAVRTALLDRATAAERIRTVGFGASRPIVGNDTAGGRQQNRRVEIVISDDATVAAPAAPVAQ